MFDKLYTYEKLRLKDFSTTYMRALYNKFFGDDRMIAIVGARGVGKSTLMLQYLKHLKENHADNASIYFSMDYPFLASMNLLEFCEKFVASGGEFLLIDEIHKYKEFALHLKAIYDLFPTLKIVVTGSCAISILNAKADLSRRMSIFKMHGLSFREYLEIKHGVALPMMELGSLVANHIEIAEKITNESRPNIYKEFKTYLSSGYYPFCFDKKENYALTLLSTINLTLENDLVALGLIEYKYSYKLKKLLEVICESEPFEVNISKIATTAEISRASLYEYLGFLHDGQMITLIEQSSKGVKKIAKPAKIYLHNTNLLGVYCNSAKTGTLRETFFVNQLSYAHKIELAEQGDFLVAGNDKTYYFEIGGESKGFEQIRDIPNSYLAIDVERSNHPNKIPLWCFGFLY